MEDQKRDFFISYTAKDRKWAEWIAWQLEAAQFTSIIQDWDFGAGSDFVEEMDRASQKARRTIAVISPDYFKSKFTKAEWHVPFAEDAAGADRKAICANNLASVLQALGDLAQARPLFERAMSISRKFLGDDHPKTQIFRRNLELLGKKLNGE